MRYEYSTLTTEYTKGVMFATISNPPANVMTTALYTDLVAFTAEVETDDRVRVVVFQSADPEFFIAHLMSR